MKHMNLQLYKTKQLKTDKAPKIITFFHTNEPLEWLIRHMLQDAYHAGFKDGKASMESNSPSMFQNHFFEFYITYIDSDLKSTAQDLSLKSDDHYNTLLDLINNREQLQWCSGFHEGCACVTHEKQLL